MQMEHSKQFCVKNNDWLIELSAEENIWNRETEAERYVTSIASWKQIVLGRLDEDGMERGGLGRGGAGS